MTKQDPTNPYTDDEWAQVMAVVKATPPPPATDRLYFDPNCRGNGCLQCEDTGLLTESEVLERGHQLDEHGDVVVAGTF